MCQVRCTNEMSKGFEVKTGLRQGYALSPVLFNLALEQVMRDVIDNRCMELVGNTTLLAYADDIVFVGQSQCQIISNTLKLIEAIQKNRTEN